MNEMKFDKGLMAGSSTLLVLSLLESGDMYGYQMIEELARRSNDAFQMKEGTLYPILHGLEKGKYLASYEQQAPTGRQRKYYRLTRRGRELLADKKEEWKNFRQGVSDVLSGGANALGAGVRGTAMKKSAFRLTRGQRTVRNVVIFLLAVAVWAALPKIPLWIIEGQIRAEARRDGVERIEVLWAGAIACESGDGGVSSCPEPQGPALVYLAEPGNGGIIPENPLIGAWMAAVDLPEEAAAVKSILDFRGGGLSYGTSDRESDDRVILTTIPRQVTEVNGGSDFPYILELLDSEGTVLGQVRGSLTDQWR